jgi:hypothetical protein
MLYLVAILILQTIPDEIVILNLLIVNNATVPLSNFLPSSNATVPVPVKLSPACPSPPPCLYQQSLYFAKKKIVEIGCFYLSFIN